MIDHRRLSIVLAAGLLLAVAALPLSAERDDDQGERAKRHPQTQERPREPRTVPSRERSQPPPKEQRREPRTSPPSREREPRREPSPPPPKVRPPAPKPPPGYVLDRRHRHDHYYPPRGHVVPVLPPAHRIVLYRNTRYYYHGGIWYRPSGVHFIVVLPPVGILVPVLPPFYTTLWVGSVPYYYADDVYYLWEPRYRSYVVAEPPPESDIQEAAAEQLYIYPQRGQSDEQQAKDRYECHRWAVEQTGFDPSQPDGNVPEAEHAGKRSDYLRAMKACLEARGYSVQ
jgi:hypothetical protein